MLLTRLAQGCFHCAPAWFQKSFQESPSDALQATLAVNNVDLA